jgi:hypothetical protein
MAINDPSPKFASMASGAESSGRSDTTPWKHQNEPE